MSPGSGPRGDPVRCKGSGCVSRTAECHSSTSQYFKASLSGGLPLPPSTSRPITPQQLVLGLSGWRGSWKWTLIHLLIAVLCCRILHSFNQWVASGRGRVGATRCSVLQVGPSLCFLGLLLRYFHYTLPLKWPRTKRRASRGYNLLLKVKKGSFCVLCVGQIEICDFFSFTVSYTETNCSVQIPRGGIRG